MDLNRATEVNAEVREAIRDAFEYHPWGQEKVDSGRHVRDSLIVCSGMAAVALLRTPSWSVGR